MDYLFIALLALWGGFSILRFVKMYDRSSPLQHWRRWDLFHLVPVGAFFSPRVPTSEQWILVRDFLHDGRVTQWTEMPRLRSRVWWHALWNPQKHVYRAKLDSARSLLSAAAQVSQEGGHLSPSFLLSEPYLGLLQYTIELPRVSEPRAIQFAVIETDIISRSVIRTVVSSVHEV
jgi:hypothetical protein